MCEILARVRGFSRSGRSDVCLKAEIFLTISLGGHGVCSYVRECIGTYMFRGSRY